MAEMKWFNAEVISILDETENTKRFFFKVPELTELIFKPGQFVTFDLPIHEKKNKRWRSYSIASPPNSTNEFELVIVHVPHGPATDYLWNNVQAGSRISFKGPQGIFTLPADIHEDLCFVSTGTGIAPFRSMLLDLIRNPRPHKNIYLLFGTRYIKDILYHNEMIELQKRISGFHYCLTLSRENSDRYHGRRGYVHSIYEELFADKSPAQFYLCGWRNMIDEAKARIVAMGYDKKAIREELYG